MSMIGSVLAVPNYYQYAHRLRVDPEGNGDFITIGEACGEAANILAALPAGQQVGIEVNANFGYQEAFDVPDYTTVFPSTGLGAYGSLGGTNASGTITVTAPIGHFSTNDYLISVAENATVFGISVVLQPADLTDINSGGVPVDVFRATGRTVWFEECSITSTTPHTGQTITGWHGVSGGLLGDWGLGLCRGILSGDTTFVRSDDKRLILKSCNFHGFCDIFVDIRMDANNSQLINCTLGETEAAQSNATWVVANSGTTHNVIAYQTRIPKEKWQTNGNGFGRVNLHETLWQDGTINDFGELSLEVLGYTPKVIRVTSDYIVTRSDTTILVDASGGDVTIELPQILVGFNRREYDIKKIDSSLNVVNIVGAVPFNRIDGAVTHTLNYQYSSITVQAYREGGFGSGWWIV